MEYTITIIDSSEARVTKDGFGYCESFFGPTFKADAIRYIKRVGGRNAKFKFADFKYEISGGK
jgi:hypothetical protein